MAIQSFSSITWILLEIPSGYFADVMGRKKSLVFNGIFAILSMLTLGLGSNFYHFLLAAFFWALAGVFISGADSALMYDTLKDLKKENSYKKIWGNITFYSFLGISIASIIGGLLGGINLRYPFLVALPFYVCLIQLAFSLYEPKKSEEIPAQNHISDLFRSIKIAIFQNKKIKQLLIYSAFIAGAISVGYYLYQPYLQRTGLNIVYFGLVFAVFNLIEALSSKYSYVVENKVGKKLSLILPFILISLCYILMGNVIFIFSFVFVFLFQFVSGVSSVVISDYINQETDSKIRATVLSAQSVSNSIFYAIIAPIVGWLVDIYTLTQALTIIGIVVLLIGMIILFFSKENRPIQS
jgi:MFS family permease